MSKINLIFHKIIGVLASTLTFASSTTDLTNIQAQTLPPVPSNPSPIDGELNFTPPNRSEPSRQESTGRRGNCPIEQPLIALFPLTEQALNQKTDSPEGLGMTTEPYPTLWFYIPKLPPDANISSAKLIMTDKAGDRYIFKLDSIPLPKQLYETDGIVGISLRNQEQLEVGQSYEWSFSIICDPQSPSKNPTVSGWVERVPDSNIKAQLEQAINDDRKRIRIYAKEGIWHEAITLLAQLRCTNPNDTQLASDWSKLLRATGQQDLDQVPIIQCLQP